MADSLNKKKGNQSNDGEMPPERNESVNIEEIEKLFSLMRENDIAELEIEQYKTKIHIVSKAAPAVQQPMVSYMPAPQYQMMPMQPQGQPPLEQQPAAQQAADTAKAAPAAGTPPSDPATDNLPPNAKTVLSPMVGTFYRASSPDAEPFVKEGDIVNDESVLCIIEAMKLMNEIKAETRGKIVRILVENGMPVEFNQPLFVLEP